MTEHTDAELRAIADKWLQQCGPCDAGLPMSCNHPDEDYRPVIATLLDRLANSERIVAVHSGFGGGPSCAEQIAMLTDRLARAEAVAARWEERRFYEVAAMQLRNSFATELRAALADDQPEDGA